MRNQTKQLISFIILILAFNVTGVFADHGNYYNYRIADASYTNLWIVAEYNHSGLVSSVSSSGDSSSYIYEMSKSDHSGNCIEYNTMATHKSGRTWFGSYSPEGDITDSIRQSIKNTAVELYNRGNVGYTWADALVPVGSPGTYISPSEVVKLRCDGLVEYCYEWNNVWVWGDSGTNYDISYVSYLGEHNNFDQPPLNPDVRLSPYAQRGGHSNDALSTTFRCSDDYYEQNDSQGTAHNLIGTSGDWLYFGRAYQFDDDWYRIRVTDDSYRRIYIQCNFTHSQGDIDIKLYDLSGNVLASSTSTTDNEIIDFTVSGVADYYIKAYYDNEGNSYNIYWDTLSSGPSSPPSAPTLSSPSDDSTVYGESIDFSWSVSTGADNYHMQLAYDSGFSNLAFDGEVGNTTSVNMSPFPDDGTEFYWRVKAGNAAGWSAYTPAWNFTSGETSIPDPPEMTSPTNGSNVSGTTIEFRWNASTGANNYYLQVATDISFNNTIFDDEVGNSIGVDMSGMPDDGTRFYWRVKAGNSTGWSGYYSTWYFDNGSLAIPSAPTLSSPSNSSNASGTSVTFSWNVSSGANNYHLQIATDSSFSNLTYDSDVGNTTSISLSDFPDDGTRFYWHVKAGNASGWSGYSSTWYFDNGTLPEHTISGHVCTSWGTGISGVTMTGWPNTPPVTDSNGYYTGTVSNGWSGTIIPSKNNHAFSPLSIAYSNVTSNQSNQDYIASVITPEDFIEDFETGDFGNHPWFWFGDVSWFITPEDVYEGNYAARSGAITDDQYTGINVTKDLSSGNITFEWKVSSQDVNDLLIFYIDGSPVGVCFGEKDWARKSYFIDEGTHTFDWVYQKDSSVSEGNDCGWIDDIIFEPEPIDPALYCWVDFHSYSKFEINMAVTDSDNFMYNLTYEDSWLIGVPAGDFTVTFESLAVNDMELVIRHLSSAYAGCQGGGYSPVTISLNGIPIVSDYDPAENHGGSHGFVTDVWPISVNAGTNTLEWTANNLCTNYWIQGIEIRYPIELEGDLDYDSIVDFNDVKMLVDYWLEDCSTPNWCGGRDIDKSGLVNFADFCRFAENWLVDLTP